MVTDRAGPCRTATGSLLRRGGDVRGARAGHGAAGQRVPRRTGSIRRSSTSSCTRVKDPYVLGAGTAAFRDVQSFFRYSAADDFGTPNPLAGTITSAIIRGVSQSGNFTRHLIFLGMNQDEAGRIVHEGAWPLIAGRRVANNSRWGQPDGVLELYQMGSEGPQWWHYVPGPRPRPASGRHPRSLQRDRTPARRSSRPSAASEVFALKMTTSWVGTDPKNDIPLPDNVRRYYLPSSTHGGGNGAINASAADVRRAVNCPGNNWGRGTLRANPVPSTALVNRMRVALRDWVMNGTRAAAERLAAHAWARRTSATLVEPTKAAMGFPSGVPGIPDSIFAAGELRHSRSSITTGGRSSTSSTPRAIPTNQPPPIKA